MKQKDVFLESEGNSWFERNRAALDARALPEADPLLMEMLDIRFPSGDVRILEVGCGDGSRLEWLAKNRGFSCCGIEPSAQAVAVAREKGVDARQGTADRVPFGDREFDVVVFGFCLYLCDREDLFRIACEADRVLKSPGWILIQDFYAPAPLRREYHHRSGLYTYKMDYSTLFTWNPAYTSFSQKIRHHQDDCYTDAEAEWTAVSVLRKRPPGDE